MSVSSSDPREGASSSLQELRAARGEGWQWTRIQRDPCPQCGDHPAALPPTSLAGLAVERAAAWREFLQSTDDTYLRTNPGPVIFSPLQYAAHVRNMLQIAGDRVMLGHDQDSPTVPMHDPADDEWESYNQLEAEELGDDLAAQARRMAQMLEGLDASAWSRIVINDRGRYGVYTFTLAGLACNAVHEEHHHLLDERDASPGSGLISGGVVEAGDLQARLAALEQRVQLLEDQLAILRLINSWGPAVDTGNAAPAAALFAEDGILETDLSYLVGPPSIAAMVHGEGHQSLIRDGSAHIQAFPIVTVDGDRATAIGYSRVYRHTEDGYEVWRVSANRWEFRRSPGGWQVSRRSNHVIDGGPEAGQILSGVFDPES